MSAGAITLQCPHCGGVFLTLQHGGIIEICPHCAVGAPRGSFIASSGPVGPRVHSELPPTKRDAGPAAARAAAVQTPVLESPLPIPPEFSASPSPAPASALVQATPTRNEVLPRTAPDSQTAAPQAATSSAPAAAPHPAPASGKTPDLLSASWPPPAAAAGTVESWTSGDRAEPPRVPPTWPGLDREEDLEPATPFQTETVQRPPEPEFEHRATPERRAPWPTLAMLVLLIGSVTWLALQGPRPVSIPRSDPPPPAASPAGFKAATTAPAVAHPPEEPAPEVKQAIPNAPPDEIVAMRARAADEHLATLAEKMVKGLENAVTHSDRLQWIDATEPQQADIRRFFEARHGRFGSKQLEPSAGKVILLPSGEEMKLFRLTTETCPEGAIVQVRERGGRAKMNWGLFEQSHEKTYDRFLSATDDGKGTSRWFMLLCQRGHSFELKGVTEKQWICLDAQGSLGASGTGQIYVNRDSAAGRFLEPKAQWGKLYLVDLLIGKMDVEGRRLNVVLDCAGLHGGAAQR